MPLPELLTFFRLQIVLGLLIPPVVAGIFYASNTNTYVPWVDCVFFCFSALTGTGLTTMDIASLSRWQQVILYLLFQIFSIPSVSLMTLLVRRISFAKYLRDTPMHREECEVVNEPHYDDGAQSSDRTTPVDASEEASKKEERTSPLSISNSPIIKRLSERPSMKSKGGLQWDRSATDTHGHPSDLGGFGNPLAPLISYGLTSLRRRARKRPPDPSPSAEEVGDQAELGNSPSRRRPTYISGDPHVARNSQFLNINAYQHREIGELEMKSMDLLLVVFFGYAVLMQLVALTIIAPDFYAGNFTDQFTGDYSTSRFWYSVFIVGSFFQNSGMSLIDSSLTGFLRDYALLLPGIVLMLCGNLLFAPVMRLILWILQCLTRPGRPLASTIAFVRDHPRRVTYQIFPPYETYLLALVVFTMVSIDWGMFFLLDIDLDVIYSIPRAPRVLAGLTQAVGVRSSGFYAITVSQTAPALHVLYLVMMLLAIYPTAMAVRATNVYEERALGLPQGHIDQSAADALHHLEQERSFVGVHLREQLAYDTWAILLGFWLITIIERHNLTNPDEFSYFSIFAVLFECASAYANVGLSLGVPYNNTSLSSSFNTLSKLVICALMVRGRTRGLPVAQDRAIMTPLQLRQHGDPPEQETGDGGFRAAKEAHQQAGS